MDTVTLETLFRCLWKTNQLKQPHFVVAADDLHAATKNCRSYPYAVIANCDSKHEAGSHWISFFVLSPTSYEFYDSYGYTLDKYTKNQRPAGKLVAENCVSLQDANSDLCGGYCLHFLLHRCKGVTYGNYLRQFSSNRRHNDEIILWFLKRLPHTFACKQIHSNQCNKCRKVNE